MESYEKNRPKKKIFSKKEQKDIFEKNKKIILKDLLPNDKINKIILIGSLAKGTFGKYEKPFNKRIYSDIDIVLYVENNFKPPKDWTKRFMGHLFQVYNIKKLQKKYLLQFMVCKKNKYNNKKFHKESDKWGVPMNLKNTKNKFRILYKK